METEFSTWHLERWEFPKMAPSLLHNTGVRREGCGWKDRGADWIVGY